MPLDNALYMPAAHAEQTVDVVAPTTVLYAPMRQPTHDDWPGVELYVPELQDVHTLEVLAPRSVLYVPRPQLVLKIEWQQSIEYAKTK